MRVRRLFSYAVLLAVLIGVLTVVVITIDIRRASACDPHDAQSERPHPRHPHRYSDRLHDATDHDAVSEHVEVVVVPVARGARG